MNRFVFETKEFFLTLIRCFFYAVRGGNSCQICGKYTALYPVCKSCEESYFSLPEDWNEKRCCLCGKKLLSFQNKCLKCRQNPVLLHTDRLFPLYSYRLWNKTLLFNWKIAGERCLSAFFAKKVSVFLSTISMQVLVPVPPRKGKIRKKGWDQINELASFLKWRYGFKILDILERRSMQEQKKLDRQQRLEHISSAYVLASSDRLKRILKPFSGKIPEEVCLIDDVSTTGSTIESCSSVLKAAGVKKVYALTLFTVD